MNDRYREDQRGRRPGSPVESLFHSRPWLLLPGAGLRLPGSRVRLAVLVGALLLSLHALVVSRRGAGHLDLAPQVAELAPDLSLPLEINQQVDGWMRRYLTDQRPVFEQYLAREGLYSDMIKSGLRSRGMPEGLVYLAAIESGFSPVALSPVSATGMWQFMGPTAQQFGLRIDPWVDERRDPIRATDAALDYLQALHDQFGSWYLAAAAYNAGPGTVARALRTRPLEDTGDEALYWTIVDLLPRETREFVPKILAAVILGEAAESYGFDVPRADPVRFDRVWVPGGTSLSSVANATGLPVARIRQLNPHLIRGVTPPGVLFAVRVPPGLAPKVVASMNGRWRTFSVDD